MQPTGEPLGEDVARLRLHAYLGDERARARLGLPDAPPEPLYEWAFGIGAWGQVAAVRAALAALDLCAALRAERHGADAPRAEELGAARVALAAWLNAPAGPGERARLEELEGAAWLDGREDWLTRTALVVASSAMTAALAPPEPVSGFSAAAARAVHGALRVAEEARVRAAVRAALVAPPAPPRYPPAP